jgi:5-methylthioadenosine/S-adenosylhomocysteine deaminase
MPRRTHQGAAPNRGALAVPSAHPAYRAPPASDMPPTSPLPADLLVEARWVVPVEPAGMLLERHAVAVREGRIVAVLPADEARRRYAAAETVTLAEHALIPGLVNLHTHAAMTVMRGYADDKPLMSWLRDHIWPAEAAHASPEMVYDGTLLACAEMIAGGVTCANDMYFFPEDAARAFLDAGMRGVLGMIAVEFPTAYATGPDHYIAKGLAMRDRLAEEPLLSFCMAPHAPYTVSDATFTRIAVVAEELDVPIHVHLHETLEEIAESLRRHGVRPLERLRGLGLATPRLIGVHGVHLTPREIDLLARNGCSIAHCPSSNLKLASGLAPVAALLDAGVNVGIGTDGAASNNRLDVFQEMRTAALLAKGVSGRADAMPARDALRAATLGGAQALGLEDRVGSIAAGKDADLVAVRLDRPETQPCFDPVSHLVYAAGREDVSHVWIRGVLRFRDRSHLWIAPRELEKLAALWHNKLVR